MAEKSPPAHEVILFVMCWRHNSSIPPYFFCHVLEAFPVHAGLSLPELTGLQVQFLMQSLNGELSAPLLVLGV
jgi:hypothetical protein